MLMNKLKLSLFYKRFYSSTMSKINSEFNEAKERLNNLPSNVENEVKLKLYGLFKQATIGPCNTTKPSSFDFVNKAKWDAWNSLGNLSKDDAMHQYVSTVNIHSPVTTSTNKQKPNKSSDEQKYEGFTFKVDQNITRITFCRPQKKNAITTKMYTDIANALKEAGANETIFTIITGEGDYFCSGNDLNNFLSFQGDIATASKDAGDLLKNFVASFIDFPKPLVVAVNGPAVGIAVTLLGLCDVIYASDKATFIAPFSLLGQTPEACASYTFPKIMGFAKANEFLMFNKKLTASEANKYGLVTEIFSDSSFKEELEKRLSTMSAVSKLSVQYSKKLTRDVEKDLLHKVNSLECERLVERWQSPDCMEAIMNFFQKKAKL